MWEAFYITNIRHITMRCKIIFQYYLHFIVFYKLVTVTKSTYPNRAEIWGNEVTGEAEAIVTDQEQERYKQNLLQYVFRTDAPSSAELNTDGGSIPFVMDKLYDLLADKETGQGKRTTPFDVDYIRGLQDHWETERRMQFWFNTSAINQTEDVIEAYFHIYKRRAVRPAGVTPGSHTISVSLYKVVDERTVYDSNGRVGRGAELLQRQHVSAYATEWVIFHDNLKELVKDWIRNPETNKGFLVSATDPDENHVNGTHIDFVQRGENPQAKQPIFVIYTDQERKKSNRSKRKQRNNIDFLVENFLNEDVRREERLRDICRTTVRNQVSVEECRTVIMRQRRSLLNQPSFWNDNLDTDNGVEDDGYEDDWEDNSSRSRRRLRMNSQPDLALEAMRRTNNYCQSKPLYISFHALGWGKWIVAPEGLNANYCDGQCPFPLTSTLTASNHAVLQSVSNHYYPDKVKAPCCVPQKLARMSILYHQTEKSVTMRNYDDMIVETCGCR